MSLNSCASDGQGDIDHGPLAEELLYDVRKLAMVVAPFETVIAVHRTARLFAHVSLSKSHSFYSLFPISRSRFQRLPQNKGRNYAQQSATVALEASRSQLQINKQYANIT